MTEIKEAVSPSQFIDPDDECPFSHEKPPTKPIKNVLIGTGGKLRTRMKNQSPTFLYKEAPGYAKESEAMEKPKATADHPFHNSKQPVVHLDLKRPGEATPNLCSYKVTCAAHHLIPAQESLKESDLMEFMISKDETGSSAEVKTGNSKSKKTGECWSNVGYDVNGSQNGVYLPGSYAVGGGTRGSAEWAKPHEEDEEPEDTSGAGNIPATCRLTGGVVIDEGNSRKWLYVKEAVDLASGYSSNRGYGGQFHDSHGDYSHFVGKILEQLYGHLVRFKKLSIKNEDCPECKEIQKKYEDEGTPTPYILVQKLNTVSQRLEVRLGGKLWYPGLYTSKWGGLYIEHLKN